MRVRETIRHGEKNSVRETFVNDSDLDAAVTALLLTSDYVYRVPRADLLAKMVESLKTTGKFQHGWSNFEVISDFELSN